MLKGKDYKNQPAGNVPVYAIGGVMENLGVAESMGDRPCIAIGHTGTVGKPRIIQPPYFITSTQYYLIPKEGFPLYYVFALLESWVDWNQLIDQFNIRTTLNYDMFLKIDFPDASFAEREQLAKDYKELLYRIEEEEKAINYYKHYKDVMLTGMFPEVKDDSNVKFDILD